jgi:hypothetical protein
MKMPSALVLVAALAASAPAYATDITEPFTGKRTHVVEFHGGFSYYGVGLIGGLRYGIPIVDNGFIGPLNNSVYINFGADFYLLGNVPGLGGGGVGVGVPVTLQWNFYFTDEWSAYGEAGLNAYFDTYTFDGQGLLFGGTWVAAAVGGRYHFSENAALIGRLGSPYASIGVELKL